MKLISEAIISDMDLTVHEEGVLLEVSGENLPLVQSDLKRRGFVHGNLSKQGVKVVITDFGPEQKRFIERLVEFIQNE